MSKDKKNKQLGQDAGTASHRLRKSILFKYIKLAGENFCFQCGAEIESENELSIEHKIPWLDSENPNELFYDLNNIAFSHLSCNVGAARRHRVEHGNNGYKRGCRCEICRDYNNKMVTKYRKNKKK